MWWTPPPAGSPEGKQGTVGLLLMLEDAPTQLLQHHRAALPAKAQAGTSQSGGTGWNREAARYDTADKGQRSDNCLQAWCAVKSTFVVSWRVEWIHLLNDQELHTKRPLGRKCPNTAMPLRPMSQSRWYVHATVGPSSDISDGAN